MEQKKIQEALNLDIFFQSLLQIAEETDESSDDDEFEFSSLLEPIKSPKQTFCYYDLDESRKWMKDLMLEESSDSDSDEENISELLKIHRQIQVFREQVHADPTLTKYMYYSSDLTTGDNKWPNHFQAVKKKSLKRKGKLSKLAKAKRALGSVLSSPEAANNSFSSRGFQHRVKSHSISDKISHGNLVKKRALSMSRKKCMSMAALRRYIWKIIVKKEIPKAYRLHVQNQTNKLTLLKKVSKEASKKIRAKAHESRLRAKKEILIARARRMTREAQVFWKKYVRVEKTQRRHAEKQAQTQRKMEDELREAQKQEQKLKFLITQTELYAKFVSGNEPEQETNLENSYEETCVAEVNVTDNSDQEEPEYGERRAYRTANAAFLLHQSKMKMYSNAKNLLKQKENDLNPIDPVQPKLLRGQLTGYQLAGVSWLFNLYRHGLNGILADDMGLGKTVQTIAFLAGLAEVWVIAPASTLNNWHQEFSRFLPDFKILPYWGTTSERKVLRLFWNQKSDCASKSEDPFHVLITSYQLATSDMRYFQKIAWHYIVLDEAHALKSSNSIRWKTLLDFNCRNRLLLTGTPVQNTMTELWALLHFIMPTLFDDHDEFNEWFAKNIESYAESKASIDESDLSRLHRILKPFILRRLKCDVEHELTEKVEVRVLCQLSPRQKVLYEGLQKNILVQELIRARSSTGHSNNNIMLMNLVMQFRKVCNHPNIFHCRDVTSPFFYRPLACTLPRLIFDSFFSSTSTKRNNIRLFYSDLNIHTPSNVSRSSLECNLSFSPFSFLRLIGSSPGEYWKVFSGSLHDRFYFLATLKRRKNREIHSGLFDCEDLSFSCQIGFRTNALSNSQISSDHHRLPALPFYTPTFIDFYNHFTSSESILSSFFFTHSTQNFASHLDHSITCLSSEDRMVSHHSPKKEKAQISSDTKKTGSTIKRRRVVTTVRSMVATEVAASLFNIYMPKVCCNARDVYCDDISALNYLKLIGCCVKKSIPITDVPRSTTVRIPDRELLVSDSGKLQALDMLLRRLKDGGHRVLVYSQMTKMIDILEEYMLMRGHSYVRLDGSCRISSRRDTVAGFQSRDEIFVFLLSTRAGGIGINLTAADTVIFYDSDWNPTVDQQAMDRAHRLGQTKQVTVYRLVCKGTVDERILARAEAKSAIQRMVIQDGGFRNDPLNQNEMVSLLLNDDQIAKASKNDDALKSSLEKAKVTCKRKYKKRTNERGTRRKRGSGSRSSISPKRTLSGPAEKKSRIVPDPLAPTQTINVTQVNPEETPPEDAVVVVDDSNALDVSRTTATAGSRGQKRRGRPRLRPAAPSTRERPVERESARGRWKGTNQRGRGGRGGRGRRRGRAFCGRVAALAGARAGALAASAATSQTKSIGFPPSAT